MERIIGGGSGAIICFSFAAVAAADVAKMIQDELSHRNVAREMKVDAVAL